MPLRRPRCPTCNDKLVAITLDPQTPPWLCTTCSRSWWHAELDPGEQSPEEVLAACYAERDAAVAAQDDER